MPATIFNTQFWEVTWIPCSLDYPLFQSPLPVWLPYFWTTLDIEGWFSRRCCPEWTAWSTSTVGLWKCTSSFWWIWLGLTGPSPFKLWENCLHPHHRWSRCLCRLSGCLPCHCGRKIDLAIWTDLLSSSYPPCLFLVIDPACSALRFPWSAWSCPF